jgi:hypothetical protein
MDTSGLCHHGVRMRTRRFAAGPLAAIAAACVDGCQRTPVRSRSKDLSHRRTLAGGVTADRFRPLGLLPPIGRIACLGMLHRQRHQSVPAAAHRGGAIFR